MYTIYINNTLPPALAVHEIYRDIFGPPMELARYTRVANPQKRFVFLYFNLSELRRSLLSGIVKFELTFCSVLHDSL